MTSEPKQSRRWVFTINNPTPSSLEQIIPAAEYLVVGNEVAPTTGTPHLQGYVFFKKIQRRARVSKLIPNAWVEHAKGTHEQCREYCIKTGDFKEYGTFPRSCVEQGRQYWVDFIASARAGTAEESHPEEYVKRNAFVVKMEKENPPKIQPLATLENVWYYGQSGAGKSRKARELYPDLFDKPLNKWWDGYLGQETVLLDDFDKNHACLSSHLKRWSDHYSFPTEIKNSFGNARPKRIIVTSQYTPEEIWPDDPQVVEAINRRFKVERVGDPPLHIFFVEQDGKRTRVN